MIFDIYDKNFQYVLRVLIVFLGVAFNSRWFDAQMPEKKHMYVLAICIGLVAGNRPRDLLDIFF
tara:strand:+ start:155 stop:346 length:192 start_codon:yes stop_codon:yes gene_type:complete